MTTTEQYVDREVARRCGIDPDWRNAATPEAQADAEARIVAEVEAEYAEDAAWRAEQQAAYDEAWGLVDDPWWAER